MTRSLYPTGYPISAPTSTPWAAATPVAPMAVPQADSEARPWLEALLWLCSGWPSGPGLVALLALLAVLLGGCASPPAQPPDQAAAAQELSLERAARQATNALLAQLPRSAWQEFTARWRSPQPLTVEPLIDTGTRQQTSTTHRAAQHIGDQVARGHGRYRLLPFRTESLAHNPLVVRGSLGPASEAGGAAARPDATRRELRLSLVELPSGKVLAQSTARVRDDQLDHTPSALFRDSPVILGGPARAGATPPSAPTNTADGIRANALFEDAVAATEAGRHSEAVQLYARAAAAPGADVMRALVGQYLAQIKLGQVDAANVVFAQIVALGLEQRSLGIKLIFKPGSTDFWPDPAVSGPYAGWIGEIARQGGRSTHCLDVVGHSSRSGSAELNERLSTQRAAVIKQRLEEVNAGLAPRTKAVGMGWRENMVGTGSDDLRDAVDRRVEFKLVGCAATG